MDTGIRTRFDPYGCLMGSFRPEVIEAAKAEREVKLTTYGRKTGQPHEVTIWITTDGSRLYIRSGQGLSRQWPQNLMARGEGLLHLDKTTVKVKPRLVPDPGEARAVSQMYNAMYGSSINASKPDEELTPGERATFELIPAD
jgi:deazaflavin-dependent oxidoreductase (nitroreductase family)